MLSISEPNGVTTLSFISLFGEQASVKELGFSLEVSLCSSHFQSLKSRNLAWVSFHLTHVIQFPSHGLVIINSFWSICQQKGTSLVQFMAYFGWENFFLLGLQRESRQLLQLKKPIFSLLSLGDCRSHPCSLKMKSWFSLPKRKVRSMNFLMGLQLPWRPVEYPQPQYFLKASVWATHVDNMVTKYGEEFCSNRNRIWPFNSASSRTG